MNLRYITPEELTQILARHRAYYAAERGQPISADAERADLSGADLRGRDLRGALLADADCHRADFTGADLRAADLSRTNFFEANLSRCLMMDTILEETNFRCAKLNGSDLTGVRLNGAQLQWAELEKAQFSGARLTNCVLLDCKAAGSVFRNADVTGVYLKGSFEGADFTGADLASAKVLGAFSGATFVDANLSGAEFNGSLKDADFGGAVLPGSALRGTYLNAAAVRKNRWSDDQVREWRKAGVTFDDETLVCIGEMSPRMFDAEFVYAGEDELGTYWNLYFINTSSYVLDEVVLRGLRRTNVQPGEQVFLCRHMVEIMWDTFWSAAHYPVQIRRAGEECLYTISINEQGVTKTKMVRNDSLNSKRPNTPWTRLTARGENR